ncbi:hypothetical protein [Microseira sp. BLCC-F43]|uniref:hypothetical protein n=1 Tax=Microseira sp. BLCC-F43 TaxID=3153602 RepID=UPI0035BA04E9
MTVCQATRFAVEYQGLRQETRFLRKIVGLATRDMPTARWANDNQNRLSGNAVA